MIPESTPVWLVILCLGVGTYSLRLSFLGLVGDKELPRWLLRHLRYTAVAVFPGLIAPLVLFPEATGGIPDPSRLAAAAVTFFVGFWTRSVLYAVIAGAVTLYTLLALIG